MAHTYTSLITHIVFSTKDRHLSIDEALAAELGAYAMGVVSHLKGKTLAHGGVEDHVHFLVEVPASLSVAELVGKIKANSSRWIHQKWPGKRLFGWQTGYGAFSVSRSNVPAVVRYIANQKEHHHRVSFQEEFLALLKKYQITYDEKFIWS